MICKYEFEFNVRAPGMCNFTYKIVNKNHYLKVSANTYIEALEILNKKYPNNISFKRLGTSFKRQYKVDKTVSKIDAERKKEYYENIRKYKK